MAILQLERSAVIALTVACALFMENLDGTVIATALPQIAESFAVSPVHLSLAITSYLLSVAIFIPASGWMADRFGSRTVFRAAIAVFMLGSILCGLSGSIAELTGARILQGIGGAMMVPIGRLVLLRNVTKADMVRAMSYLTVPALLGPVLGPPVGGFIVTYVSWRWIFFLNVPIGILGLVLVSILIENYKEAETPPFDVAGFALTAIGLVGTMSGFDAIGRGGLPRRPDPLRAPRQPSSQPDSRSAALPRPDLRHRRRRRLALPHRHRRPALPAAAAAAARLRHDRLRLGDADLCQRGR